MAADRTLALGVDSRGAVRGFRRAERSAKGFSREARGATRSTKGLQSATSKVRRVMGALAAGGLAAGAMGFAAKKAFDLAAQVEETGNRFDTVFGAATERVQAFGDSFATMAGLSQQEFQSVIATTGQIAQGMGFAEQEAANFSIEITKLAGDLTSFNDVPIERTSRAIQAALTGEREQLKRLGIVIREADVQQRALARSGRESADALTQQERAAATLELITERAGVAVGDLARTQDSAQNRARALRAQWQNVKEEIATGLMPALEDLLPLLSQLVERAGEMAQEVEGMTQAFLDLAGVVDQVASIEQAGILASLRGHDRAGKMSFLGERLQQEARAARGLREELAGVEKNLEKVRKNAAASSVAAAQVGTLELAARELRDELKSSESVMDFIVAKLDEIANGSEDAASGVDGAAGSVGNLTERMKELPKELLKELEDIRPVIGNLAGMLPQALRDAAEADRQARLKVRAFRMGLGFSPEAERQPDVELDPGSVTFLDRLEVAGQKAGGVLESMGKSVLGVLKALNPWKLILDALSHALGDFLRNMTPIVEMIGSALTPILKALFPIFKMVTVAATYLGQVIFNVAGGITKAIGWAIRTIGKAIDLIPFVSGDSIIRAGQRMMDLGDGFIEAAAELATARDEIKALEWTEAADNVKDLGDAASEAAAALLNAPSGFKIALERFRATTPEFRLPPSPNEPNSGTDFTVAGGGGGGFTMAGSSAENVEVHVTIQAPDGRQLFEVVDVEARRARSRGGNTSLTQSPTIRRN